MNEFSIVFDGRVKVESGEITINISVVQEKMIQYLVHLINSLLFSRVKNNST
jgi:hypothetical protein